MNKQSIFFIGTIFGGFGVQILNQYVYTQPWYIQIIGVAIFAVIYFFVSAYVTSIHKSKDSKEGFIQECIDKCWDLDVDDMKHIMNGDFDYVRKANTIAVDDVDKVRERVRKEQQ